MAVIVVPLAFVIGQVSFIVFAATVETFPDISALLVVKRGVFAMGLAAACSVFLVLNNLLTVQGVSARVGKQLVVSIPTIVVFATSFAFAWQIVSTTNQTVGLDVIALFASSAFVWTSYRYSERAWFPRTASRLREEERIAKADKYRLEPLPSGRGTACLHVFWLRHAKLGAGACLTYLVVLGSCTLYLGGSVSTSLDPDYLAMFLGLWILMIAFLAPIFIPDVRSMRMIPLSRTQLALLQTSFPLSFSVSALAFVPVASYLFGFEQVMTLAVVAVLVGLHFLLTVVTLRWGYRTGRVLGAIMMLAVMVMGWESNLGSSTLLVAAGFLALFAVGSTSFLIGNSSRIYQRIGAYEELRAVRKQW